MPSIIRFIYVVQCIDFVMLASQALKKTIKEIKMMVRQGNTHAAHTETKNFFSASIAQTHRKRLLL